MSGWNERNLFIFYPSTLEYKCKKTAFILNHFLFVVLDERLEELIRRVRDFSSQLHSRIPSATSGIPTDWSVEIWPGQNTELFQLVCRCFPCSVWTVTSSVFMYSLIFSSVCGHLSHVQQTCHLICFFTCSRGKNKIWLKTQSLSSLINWIF